MSSYFISDREDNHETATGAFALLEGFTRIDHMDDLSTDELETALELMLLLARSVAAELSFRRRAEDVE